MPEYVDMTTAKQRRNTPTRDVDADLGRRAHMLIWDHGLTQGKVASQIGIGSDSFGRKLKGQTGWALAEIVALADVLNTTVAYLVGETDETPEPTSNRRAQDYKGDGSLEVITLDSVRRKHPSRPGGRTEPRRGSTGPKGRAA